MLFCNCELINLNESEHELVTNGVCDNVSEWLQMWNFNEAQCNKHQDDEHFTCRWWRELTVCSQKFVRWVSLKDIKCEWNEWWTLNSIVMWADSIFQMIPWLALQHQPWWLFQGMLSPAPTCQGALWSAFNSAFGTAHQATPHPYHLHKHWSVQTTFLSLDCALMLLPTHKKALFFTITAEKLSLFSSPKAMLHHLTTLSLFSMDGGKVCTFVSELPIGLFLASFSVFLFFSWLNHLSCSLGSSQENHGHHANFVFSFHAVFSRAACAWCNFVRVFQVACKDALHDKKRCVKFCFQELKNCWKEMKQIEVHALCCPGLPLQKNRNSNTELFRFLRMTGWQHNCSHIWQLQLFGFCSLHQDIQSSKFLISCTILPISFSTWRFVWSGHYSMDPSWIFPFGPLPPALHVCSGTADWNLSEWQQTSQGMQLCAGKCVSCHWINSNQHSKALVEASEPLLPQNFTFDPWSFLKLFHHTVKHTWWAAHVICKLLQFECNHSLTENKFGIIDILVSELIRNYNTLPHFHQTPSIQSWLRLILESLPFF